LWSGAGATSQGFVRNFGAGVNGFDLFVSYVRADVSRVIDGATFDIVSVLKRALEAHVHPDDRRRRFRVCTDVEDLELDSTVSTAIRNKIESATQILIICSHAAGTRPYVVEEIDIFRRAHPQTPPLGAYLDLQPSDAFPDVFGAGAIGADLHPRDRVTRREYRRQLERESHKIAANVWKLPLQRVHDRFIAEQRRLRRRMAIGVVLALIAVLMGIIGTAGEWGLHAVRELPLRERVVSPAGAGFFDAGRHAAIVDDGRNHVWNLRDGTSAVRGAPRYAIDAHVLDDGRVLALEPNTLTIDSRPVALPGTGTLAEIAVSGESIAVVSEDGELIVGNLRGGWSAAPRPETTILRWAPAAFQERGPLRYGDNLAWSDDGTWLASATGTGQLIVLQPARAMFLKGGDPIVYETENTRPIGGMIFLGDRLLFVEGTLGLRAVDLANGNVEKLELQPLPLIREFVRAGDRLIGASSETLEVFDLENGALRWRQRVALAPKSLPHLALAPDGRTLLVAYFDDRPDLFRWTWRVFGADVWTR
jgi:hypothetical protein